MLFPYVFKFHDLTWVLPAPHPHASGVRWQSSTSLPHSVRVFGALGALGALGSLSRKQERPGRGRRISRRSTSSIHLNRQKIPHLEYNNEKMNAHKQRRKHMITYQQSAQKDHEAMAHSSRPHLHTGPAADLPGGGHHGGAQFYEPQLGDGFAALALPHSSISS